MTDTTITGAALIPEVLAAHPGARRVFDRYGLAGCGGALGPPESVEFFAGAHGVDLATLLAELGEAAASPAAVPAATLPVADRPQLRDRIYKRFFLAGIAAVLTVGAGWGAWLLLTIAANGSFTAPSIFAVNAHGQAQIYGWVGLFILGFAYQAFPRFKHTELRLVPLANLSFFLMAAGIVLRSLTEPLAPSPWSRLALVGAGLEMTAVLLFVAVVSATFKAAEKRLETYDRYILAAVAWFVAAGAFDLFHLAGTLGAGGREALLRQVATYQFALRDLQIHGLAMMMIFGVSLRYFPAILGTAPPSDRLARALWWPLNLAIAGEVVGFVGFMRTNGVAFAVLMGVATLVLAGCAVAYAANLRLFRRAEPERSLKFLRASHVWLVVSMVMLVAAPLYFKLAGHPFSHAWYGAMRHAITVGFISLTIMGVAAKVVPTLSGIHTRQLGELWVPFLLVNAGCTLRVGGQVVTDFTVLAFPYTGISGLLEVTGLAIWGVGLAWVMLGRVRPGPLAALRPGAIDGEDTVAAVLEAHPRAAAALRDMGFGLIDNPVLRRTLARGVTLRQACALKGRELGAVLERLNAVSAAPTRAAGALDFGATVSEWVRRYPATLAVFAGLGMDSCCGGAESVINAARHNHVDLARLEAELAAHVG